jgi:hypothetical protein
MDDLPILIPTTNPQFDVMPQKGKRRPLISTETTETIVRHYVEHSIQRNKVVLDGMISEEVTARSIHPRSCRHYKDEGWLVLRVLVVLDKTTLSETPA